MYLSLNFNNYQMAFYLYLFRTPLSFVILKQILAIVLFHEYFSV